MPQRRGFQQLPKSEYLLKEEAISLRKQAEGMPPSIRRDELLRQVAQVDVAEINEWLISSGLRAPIQNFTVKQRPASPLKLIGSSATTPEGSGMIGGNDDKAIAAHLASTLDVADKILKSADEDPNDAFLKAVGILAQVIFVTVNGEHREEILAVAADKLRNYLNLLDEVSGKGEMVARRQH